jgi:hypothetical protein
LKCLGVLAGASLAARTASAEPKFEFGKKEEVKEVEWVASAEAGLIITTGSSQNTTLTAGFKASRKEASNKFSAEASAAYARTGTRVLVDLNGNGTIDNDDEIRTERQVSAETLAGKLRYDRFLTDSNSLFIAALASRDLPAGKRSVIGAQAGYSRQLYKSDEIEAVAELGYDFAREALVGGDAVAIHSVRGFTGVKAAVTEDTHLDASIELLTNLNEETLPTGKDGAAFRDTRVNGRLAVTSKLSASLSVQASIEAKFDNRPGPLTIKLLAPGFVPEAQNLDTISKASLIYAF